MTRLGVRPLKRVVKTMSGEFVAEFEDWKLRLRPLRARAGGPGEVSIPWGAIYLRCMMARVEDQRGRKKGRRH